MRASNGRSWPIPILPMTLASSSAFRLSLFALAIATTIGSSALAQTVTGEATAADEKKAATTAQANDEVDTIVVNASADASAGGLAKPFAGGQVATGGRAGILGTHDHLDTPFSITSYTNELIQDRQAKSVGDVLQNDPTVRVARGFGNFQESYFIRGFILGSDDVAYNGLYSLLPRQYIATELFERVEVLRGASAFLTGANPGGGGLGGAINLLPRRAPNEPLTRLTVGAGSGLFGSTAIDVARRFGKDGSTGLRLNAAYRDGDTAVDDEGAKLGLVSLGADWRSDNARLSADIGWQDNQLQETRPNVSLQGVTRVPRAPDSSSNFSQPWSYSYERDLFGTFRGEYDLGPAATVWGAYGLRRSSESNSLANLSVTNGDTGDGYTSRFDNTREDEVDTGEVGLRGKLQTGPISHEWVIAASSFRLERRNAYIWDFFNQLATNLYNPTSYDEPAYVGVPSLFQGGTLSDPKKTGVTKLDSVAFGDTLALIDDRLLVTVGARHQNLKITDYAYGTAEKVGTAYDKSRLSPVGGVVFKLTPQMSVYANYVEGLTQGETAPIAVPGSDPAIPVTNGGNRLKPYVTKQKEVGVKYETKRLGLSGAVFSTDKPRAILDDTNTFTSQGEDRHQGLELNSYGVLTQGMRVLGGLTWLDTEQRKTNTASEGNQVIGVPKFQASFGAECDVSGIPGFAVDARVVHTGKNYADSGNTLEVDSWTRLDMGMRYLFDYGSLPVTLRGRIDNVFDRDYWASSGGFPENGYLVAGAPRSLVVTASVDF